MQYFYIYGKDQKDYKVAQINLESFKQIKSLKQLNELLANQNLCNFGYISDIKNQNIKIYNGIYKTNKIFFKSDTIKNNINKNLPITAILLIYRKDNNEEPIGYICLENNKLIYISKQEMLQKQFQTTNIANNGALFDVKEAKLPTLKIEGLKYIIGTKIKYNNQEYKIKDKNVLNKDYSIELLNQNGSKNLENVYQDEIISLSEYQEENKQEEVNKNNLNQPDKTANDIELSENNNQAFNQLFNDYQDLLKSQLNYIKKESSIAVICEEKIKFFNSEDTVSINKKACEDIINKKLYINGDMYYKLITDSEYYNIFIEKAKKTILEEFKKIKKDITVNDPEYKTISDKLIKKCSVAIIKEYIEGLGIRFIIYSLQHDIDKKDIANKHFFSQDDQLNKEGIVENKQKLNIFRFDFGIFIDEEAYNARPFFATRLKGEILEDVKSDNFNPIIGRKTKDNSPLALKFSAAQIEQKFVFLVAGSRSGKGVLTLCQLAEALAKGYNTFYIDCKPDMAMSLYNDISKNAGKETFAVDGFTISESKHVNIEIDNKPYYEYAYEKLEENVPGILNCLGEKKDLFVNLLGYTRAINNIVYLTTKQADNNLKEDSPYGKTPCFVVIDEIEQYCKVLDQMFFFGEVPSKQQYGGIIGQIIHNSNTPINVQMYLKSIIRYIRTTWTEFGNLSQSKLGQSLMKIFVICQHPHIDYWCKPVSKALSMYANGATFILGNESHQGNGAKKYGCLEFQGEGRPEDHLGMGKFILKEKTDWIPFKSIFLLNQSTIKDNKPHPKFVGDMYDRLSDDGVRKLVNRELFGINDESTFDQLKDKPLIETGIGFKEFTDYLCKKSGKEYTSEYYLEKGFTYMKNHIPKYKSGVWENFYNFSYDSLEISKDVNTEFIDAIELLLQSKYKELLDERYITIIKAENRYEINSEEYLDTLKNQSNTNHLWPIYSNQSQGNSTVNDVKNNEPIIKELFEGKGRYKIKPLDQQLKEKVEDELDVYIQQIKDEGNTLNEQQIEAKKEELTNLYKDQYKDDSLKEKIRPGDTEYIITIQNYANDKYNKVFNEVLKLDKENNQYYIKLENAKDALMSDETGLPEIYNSQLATAEHIGLKNSKKDAENQEVIFKFFDKWYKEQQKNSENQDNQNKKLEGLEEQDSFKKVNANYAKEKASDKQNFTLTRGHIQLTRENSSFTTVQETDTRFISLLGEPASDKEVKLTEKFYDNWLNKPFGAENEIVSLSNKFTRSVLTSEKPSKITSLKLTDTEVIVNDQRLNTDLNLSIGLQKSHLFNFNSHNFKSLKNLIQLYLSESYVEKAGKDLNLPFKNTFIELSDYLFKHFKYLNKLIIEKYTGERIGITRDMWGKGLENAVELLNDQEEINNNIKNSEYKNAADIGLKETFPKKYKGKQSANFITSNSYNRNGLYDKFTRKASYGKRYNGRKTNPVITTFRILIGGPYLLGSMLFDKIGSLFKGKS